MKSPFRLDNRIALIAGGPSGIDHATARAFTRAGASVIILSIDQPRAETIALELSRESAWGGNIAETSLDDQRLFRVNVQGTFIVTKAALDLIIIRIGSVAGLIGVKRLAYCPHQTVCGGLSHGVSPQLHLPRRHRHGIRRGSSREISQARKRNGSRESSAAPADRTIGKTRGSG